MSDATVMIGVGAAKAGTSWLHRYLDDHPECHFRAIKELQYFNALDWGPEVWELKRKRIAVLKAELVAQAEAPGLPPRRLANKVRMLADVEHYTELLDRGVEDRAAYLNYLSHGAGRARVIGELTPAYSLLGEDRLRSMAAMATDVRFVYLLRDPVERFWSHVRMIARTRCQHPSEFADRARNIYSRVFKGLEDHIVVRSDYAGALARLNAAIDPRKLCVEVYEDIFGGNALTRICAFLGIKEHSARPDKAVNAGQPLAMTPEQRARARDWLAPQYDAVRAYFGQLPPTWEFEDVRIA